MRLVLASLALVALGLAARTAPADPPASGPTPSAEPGRLGIQPRPVEFLTPEERAKVSAPERSVVLMEVTPGGPADRAGVKLHDVLVSVGGKPVPALDPSRPVEEWGAAMRAMFAGVHVGDVVELGVARGAEKLTLKATAVSAADIERLRTMTMPELAAAGEPKAWTEGFETLAAGAPLPAGFFPATGRWSVVAATGEGASGRVLRQDQVTQPWAVALFAGPGRALRDGTVRVRFRPVSGQEDASGGIVVRAIDAKNYYLCRANANEDNLRIYSMKDGTRWQLATVAVPPPALGTWHVIEMTVKGNVLRATLDGKDAVEAKDDLFRGTGWCGLWTKADSVTEFDDFSVTPAAK
jgi:hypothetical protein